MVLFDQINESLSNTDEDFFIDIGDKQHSITEARRICKCYDAVIHRERLYIIRNSLYSGPDWNVVSLSGVMDGWSRGICFSIFLFLIYTKYKKKKHV